MNSGWDLIFQARHEISFGIAMIMTMTAVFSVLMFQLKARDKSRYIELEHRVRLSELRESYERRIATLQAEMTATERRWKEANHLLIDGQQRSAASKFLKLENFAVDPRLVFYLTPFADSEIETFHVVRRICSHADFNCVSGDETQVPGPILNHIIELIGKARIVIANVGSRNANVMYELGIAHAMNKEAILIARAGSDISFDMAHLRIILFNDFEELESLLTKALLRSVSRGGLA